MAYSSHVMQSVDIRLCMHVDMLMAFTHAKFQMATYSYKQAVAV